MRIIERKGRRRAAAEPPPEPAPDWWGPLFADRQRRLRKRIVRRLGVDGETATATLYYGITQFERPEIDEALCSLALDGVLLFRRAVEPRRHGATARDTIEVTYWRLATPED